MFRTVNAVDGVALYDAHKVEGSEFDHLLERLGIDHYTTTKEPF
jgi:hypothetical protein